MPVSWDDPEFESIFKALSKNNLLGFNFEDATTTLTYEYNDDGFPIKKTFPIRIHLVPPHLKVPILVYANDK